jgi:hypothetical protein
VPSEAYKVGLAIAMDDFVRPGGTAQTAFLDELMKYMVGNFILLTTREGAAAVDQAELRVPDDVILDCDNSTKYDNDNDKAKCVAWHTFDLLEDMKVVLRDHEVLVIANRVNKTFTDEDLELWRGDRPWVPLIISPYHIISARNAFAPINLSTNKTALKLAYEQISEVSGKMAYSILIPDVDFKGLTVGLAAGMLLAIPGYFLVPLGKEVLRVAGMKKLEVVGGAVDVGRVVKFTADPSKLSSALKMGIFEKAGQAIATVCKTTTVIKVVGRILVVVGAVFEILAAVASVVAAAIVVSGIQSCIVLLLVVP